MFVSVELIVIVLVLELFVIVVPPACAKLIVLELLLAVILPPFGEAIVLNIFWLEPLSKFVSVAVPLLYATPIWLAVPLTLPKPITLSVATFCSDFTIIKLPITEAPWAAAVSTITESPTLKLSVPKKLPAVVTT